VKLVVASLVMSIIIGIVGTTGLTNLNELKIQLDVMYQEQVLPIANLGNTETLFQKLRVNVRELEFMADTLEEEKEEENLINSIREEIDHNLETYEKGAISEKEQEILDRLHIALDSYYPILEQVVTYAKEDNQTAILSMGKEFTSSGRNVTDILNELVKFNIEMARQVDEESAEMYEKALITTIIIVVISVIASIVMGYAMAQLIAKPLKKVVTLVEQVAQGDLTQMTDIDSKDEVGVLAKSMNTMVKNLRTMMQEVLRTAEMVAASSEELTASSEQTSRATEEITMSIQGIAEGAETSTASLEESATGLEEVTLGIQNIAESSNTISESGSLATYQAKAGGEFVEKTVQQIQAINHSVNESGEAIKSLDKRSQEIGEITKVITEIANQTNLLALNAAIEAARAGEHGKGFAVVADEVRKLAKQSQHSSTQISELIKEIQVDMSRSNKSIEQVKTDVHEGLNIVGKTEDSFKLILDSLNNVSLQIDDMAATAEQMSASAQEVSANVASSASVSREASMNSQSVAASTEEQLASMEEISSASNGLSQMAMNLQELISKFKL
ncbi:MAG: methyl-accepting chemotaxis protein, partial [Psychrobacillus psychrotolerans]